MDETPALSALIDTLRHAVDVLREQNTALFQENAALRQQVADGSVKNLGRYAASWIAWWPKRPSSTAALT